MNALPAQTDACVRDFSWHPTDRNRMAVLYDNGRGFCLVVEGSVEISSCVSGMLENRVMSESPVQEISPRNEFVCAFSETLACNDDVSSKFFLFLEKNDDL